MMMMLMKTMMIILMMSVEEEDDDVETLLPLLLLLQKKEEKKNYLFEELCMWFDILNISYLYVHLFLPSVNVCSATAYVRRYIIILSASEGGVSVCGTHDGVGGNVGCCLAAADIRFHAGGNGMSAAALCPHVVAPPRHTVTHTSPHPPPSTIPHPPLPQPHQCQHSSTTKQTAFFIVYSLETTCYYYYWLCTCIYIYFFVFNKELMIKKAGIQERRQRAE